MSQPHTPPKENDRLVLELIQEGREMTAAEIRAKTGMTKGKVQSALMRLHQNGYIRMVRKEKNGRVWGPN